MTSSVSISSLKNYVLQRKSIHLLRMMTPARKIQALTRMIRLLTPNTNTSESVSNVHEGTCTCTVNICLASPKRNQWIFSTYWVKCSTPTPRHLPHLPTFDGSILTLRGWSKPTLLRCAHTSKQYLNPWEKCTRCCDQIFRYSLCAHTRL